MISSSCSFIQATNLTTRFHPVQQVPASGNAVASALQNIAAFATSLKYLPLLQNITPYRNWLLRTGEFSAAFGHLKCCKLNTSFNRQKLGAQNSASNANIRKHRTTYVIICFRIRRYRIRAANIAYHNVQIHFSDSGTMAYTYTNITMENIGVVNLWKKLPTSKCQKYIT